VILQAEILDDQGNRSLAHRDVWIAEKRSGGSRQAIMTGSICSRKESGMSLEKRQRFKSACPSGGDRTRHRGERRGDGGVVQKLSGKNPVLEVPMKGNYAPNVYVSALVVRGRVAGVQPTALVDLGKPATNSASRDPGGLESS